MKTITQQQARGLTVGETYKFKYQNSPILKYLGYNWSGNGYWHQFGNTEENENEVWSELNNGDLHLIEQYEIEE